MILPTLKDNDDKDSIERMIIMAVSICLSWGVCSFAFALGGGLQQVTADEFDARVRLGRPFIIADAGATGRTEKLPVVNYQNRLLRSHDPPHPP